MHTDTKIVIPDLCARSIKIECMAEDTVVMTGSGFTIDLDGELWLVTNRHVALNRIPKSNDYAVSLMEPTQLRLSWLGLDFSPSSMTVALFDENNSEQWVEHYSLAHELDLIAIRIPTGDFLSVDPYAAFAESEERSITSGAPVVVVGYPFGLDAGFIGLATMISGMIASPPGISMNELPRFLIDSRTRQGMSGSPVYFHQYMQPNSKSNKGVKSGVFLGMYCGRINRESDLGYVIEAAEIIKTLARGKKGKIIP